MKKIAGNQFCLLLFVPDSENRYATFRFTFTETSVQYDMSKWVYDCIIGQGEK